MLAIVKNTFRRCTEATYLVHHHEPTRIRMIEAYIKFLLMDIRATAFLTFARWKTVHRNRSHRRRKGVMANLIRTHNLII